MKEHDKTPETDLNETKVSYLFDEEFIIMITKFRRIMHE